MRVKTVKIKNYSGVTVDIEVENTHSYQLQNGIVTHNSTSAMLGTSSGIHAHHAKRYLRRVQSNKLEAPANFYSAINPVAVEESAWSASKNDVVISFYCESSPTAIVSKDLSAIQLLEKVKSTQQNWVIPGTNEDLCVFRGCTHNVSNTIYIRSEKEWSEVEDFIFNNQQYFTGVSVLSGMGDKDYNQAPFVEVFTAEEIVQKYGNAALYTSGLIESAVSSFGDLWSACACATGFGEVVKVEDLRKRIKQSYENGGYEVYAEAGLHPKSSDEKLQEYLDKKVSNWFAKQNFVNRLEKFSQKHFSGDISKAQYLLKDVYLNKYTNDLIKYYKNVDFTKMIEEENNVNLAENLACAGGSCTI